MKLPPAVIAGEQARQDLERKILINGPDKGLPLIDRVKETILNVCVDAVDNSIADLPLSVKIRDVTDIDAGGVVEVIKLVRETVFQFCPQGLTVKEISSINGRVAGGTAGETVLISFIYRMLGELRANFDQAELHALAVKIMSATAGFSNGSNLVRTPGWVPEKEAQEFIENVYWVMPMVFLSTVSYAEFKRRANAKIAARGDGGKNERKS